MKCLEKSWFSDNMNKVIDMNFKQVVVTWCGQNKDCYGCYVMDHEWDHTGSTKFQIKEESIKIINHHHQNLFTQSKIKR